MSVDVITRTLSVNRLVDGFAEIRLHERQARDSAAERAPGERRVGVDGLARRRVSTPTQDAGVGFAILREP